MRIIGMRDDDIETLRQRQWRWRKRDVSDGQRLVALYPSELQMLMVWTGSNLSRNQSRLLWFPVSGGAGA